MRRLTAFLRIQSLIYLVFAFGWFFVPDFVNDTILGWETETFFPRVMGGGFFALAYGAWVTANRLTERMDLIWLFAALPLGYTAAMIWERLSDDYSGNDLFWWTCGAITLISGLGVLVLGLQARRERISTIERPRRRELVG